MPKVQIVKDMEIDEVSLVDRAACQPAAIVIAKRAHQEDDMPLYDEDDNEIDLNDLAEGTIVVDEDGQEFEVVYEDQGEDAEQGELVGVGKSAFGAAAYDDGVIAGIREELSKALGDSDQATAVSKAFDTLAKRAEAAEARVAKAEQIAKAERDLRLEREYIAKAAEYNVPVAPEELGPVLMRATESLSYEDCAVIHKALTAAGQMLYTEAGYDGRAAAEDPLAALEAELAEQVSKGADGAPVSKAAAMTAFFDQNPEAYDALRADRTR